MGRKQDPLREKRGPGRKARKQRGAEVELARFLPHGKSGTARAAKRRLGAASGPAGRKEPGGGRQPAGERWAGVGVPQGLALGDAFGLASGTCRTR
uniref:Uncharacterized protein n=1 Tax=Anser cygnoides TaxID=8845 RepID=A0A8B9IJD0_ANSCY